MASRWVATGTLKDLDLPGAVRLLAHYLEEVEGEKASAGRPSVARLETEIARAMGPGAIATVDVVAGHLVVILNAERRRQIEDVVRLLGLVASGDLVLIDRDEVWRYLLRGGGAFVQRGRVALSPMRPMTGW